MRHHLNEISSSKNVGTWYVSRGHQQLAIHVNPNLDFYSKTVVSQMYNVIRMAHSKNIVHVCIMLSILKST